MKFAGVFIFLYLFKKPIKSIKYGYLSLGLCIYLHFAKKIKSDKK